MNEIQNYFKENKYVVIRNFLSTDLCTVFYEYCKTKVSVMDYKSTYVRSDFNKIWDGMFGDGQINDTTYSCYGDILFDTLLKLSLNKMIEYTGLNLSPNYSYWRFYQKHDVLKRHMDRDSCEISTTLCLGFDISDVDNDKYPNYNWAMWVKNDDGTEIPIQLSPGDMIIYRGCEIEHWRDKFLGKNQAQVFMHYNDINTTRDHKIYDGRPMLGLPKTKRD